jgi:CubicO group peptidase (beta-lactamase class C family)
MPWHYCTAGTVLLGQIVQRAAKQPIDAFLAEHLFAPLGITRYEFSRSPSGEVMTGGGLRLTTRDLGSLGWLVRSGGAWRGRQVVPEAWVRAALTAHRRTAFEQDYGYLFWGRSFRPRCGGTERRIDGWMMSGNGGNAVVILAELDAVIVVTRTSYNTRGMHDQTARLIEEQILPELACGKA